MLPIGREWAIWRECEAADVFENSPTILVGLLRYLILKP
jgi:hypothetical protein